jgi:hypothetical protein
MATSDVRQAARGKISGGFLIGGNKVTKGSSGKSSLTGKNYKTRRQR